MPGIGNCTDSDAVTVYANTVVIVFNARIEQAMYAVVLEQVGIDGAFAEVVDGNDLQMLAVILRIQRAQDVTANSTKTIDSDTQRQKLVRFWFCCWKTKITPV